MKTTEVILDDFVETLFRLMLDQHQTQVVEMDMTLAQAQAIRLLRRAPVSTTKLAVALGISAPAVTQLADRLVRKQLIERRAVEGDRRSVLVALTEKGSRVVDRFRQRRNDVFAQALSRLSEGDRAQVTDALGKVLAALVGYEPRQFKDAGALNAFRAEQVDGRTAVQPAEASNQVGQIAQAPVGLPARRKKMRIEWD